MLFVGIDLAWSPRNNTAVTVIKGGRQRGKIVSYNKHLRSNEEILEYVFGVVGEKKALIGIDAPLIVPNSSGSRLADKMVNHFFSRYDAGCYPANRSNLGKYGGLRGEELVSVFEEEGFEHSPFIGQFEQTRKVFEVFPHPATVVLFNLPRILKYKPRQNRSYQYRWGEFSKFQSLLASLKKAKPSLSNVKDYLVDVNGFKGKKLKEHEDFLDSIICAYTSYYSWVRSREVAVLGNMKEGYILTPIFDWMQEELREYK